MEREGLLLEEYVSSQFSKNNILPLGLSDGLIVKEDIKKVFDYFRYGRN